MGDILEQMIIKNKDHRLLLENAYEEMIQLLK